MQLFIRLQPTIPIGANYICGMGLRGRTNLKDYHCYFVTTTCYRFIPLLQPAEIKTMLLDNLAFYNEKYFCRTVAYVLMPEHFHMICYFEQEPRLSDYMRDFKKFTSFRIRTYYERNNSSTLRKLRFEQRAQKFKAWMTRFDDLVLYSRKVVLTKLNYIHYNPVKRSLCTLPEDYEYSSARFYLKGTKSPLNLLHVEEIL